MALPPKFSGQMLNLSSASPEISPHTLEIYLDYVCPFSAKIFKTLYDSVIPQIKSQYTEPGVRVIFRQQIQPWHPSSTLVHEVGAAVLRLAPDKFWEFSAYLFDKQKDYFDVSVVHQSRNETYKHLAKLAGRIDGIEEGHVYDLLKISEQPDKNGGLNIGNQVTDDMKVMVKMNRMQGVHVTPTVVFDGVVDNSISSGWSKEQWQEWCEKNLK